jgi:tRNA (guanine-N7-)-methyltransferase
MNARDDTAPDDAPSDPAPEGSFFGRRKGKSLRAAQAGRIEDVLPGLRLPLDRLADPLALFPGRPASLRVEIGFGGGEHLAAQALAHPDQAFIGCEPFVNGVAKLVAAVEALALRNVRIHDRDAVELLARLPAGSCTRIDLLYPDPWPKRRQRKRRFVSDERLAAIARALEPGGEFRFATDIDDYAAWTLERAMRSPDLVWTAERADDWREAWPGWTRTRYEAKAIREGRRPSYLIFRRR